MSLRTSDNYWNPVAATWHTDDSDIYSRLDSYTAFLMDLEIHDHRMGYGLGIGRITSAPILATFQTGECQVVTGGMLITDGTTQNALLDPSANGLPFLKITGLSGATAASRYVGATTNGVPTGGTFQTGDFIIDQTGSIWVCVAGGMPGSWKSASIQSGSVTGWPSTTPPDHNAGFICNHQELSRTTYAGIFAVIGTTFGAGDGSSTFNVPDLVGRTIFGADAGGTRLSASNTMAASSGAYSHVLTGAESGVNSHTHGPGTLNGTAAPNTNLLVLEGNVAGTSNYSATGAFHNRNATPTDVGTVTMNAGTTGAAALANASSALVMMPPNQILNWVIWA